MVDWALFLADILPYLMLLFAVLVVQFIKSWLFIIYKTNRVAISVATKAFGRYYTVGALSSFTIALVSYTLSGESIALTAIVSVFFSTVVLEQLTLQIGSIDFDLKTMQAESLNNAGEEIGSYVAQRTNNRINTTAEQLAELASTDWLIEKAKRTATKDGSLVRHAWLDTRKETYKQDDAYLRFVIAGKIASENPKRAKKLLKQAREASQKQ